MMLVRADVDAELVAEPVLVEHLVEELLAAIFGSQYRFGRLARAEGARSITSCGTNG